jgi:DNA-directed RNA polymerase specialized sigma24 family protein
MKNTGIRDVSEGDERAFNQVASYARAAARKSAFRRGPLPPGKDPDDVVQEVGLELTRQLGRGCLYRIDQALRSPSGFKATREYRALVLAVGRALSRVRGRQDKRRQRYRKQKGGELPTDVSLDRRNDKGHEKEGTAPSVESVVQCATDIASLMTTWSPLERQVARMLNEGYKQAEIAAELGLDPRRVSEIKGGLQPRLASYLR